MNLGVGIVVEPFCLSRIQGARSREARCVANLELTSSVETHMHTHKHHDGTEHAGHGGLADKLKDKIMGHKQ